MINNKWVRTAVAAAILAGSGSVMAEVTGNVAVVSDYLFDGFSQTDNGPALQGGVDWSHESGLYIGAWASNVDIGDASIELDTYIGYGFGTDDVSFDVGFVQYTYKDDPNDFDGDGEFTDSGDYSEVYFGVTFAENTTLKYWRASDYFNYGETTSRLKLTHDIAINDDWSVGLEFTRGMYDDLVENYNHYRVGVATTIGGFGLDLSYHKTNADAEAWELDDEDLVAKDGILVLSVSKDFGGE